MIDGAVANVGTLWAAHHRAAFPPRLRGAEVAGVDMVMLDAEVAGYVSSWLKSDGSLDGRQRAALVARRDKLDRVVSKPVAEEAAYYGRLRKMLVLVLGDH